MRTKTPKWVEGSPIGCAVPGEGDLPKRWMLGLKLTGSHPAMKSHEPRMLRLLWVVLEETSWVEVERVEGVRGL